MKTTTKPQQLAIQSTLDQETWEIELEYGAKLQKQFGQSLELVKATNEHLRPARDEMGREHFEETLTNLSDLALGQLWQLEIDGVSDIIGELALTLLERKKLHKTLGPLRSAMEALAALPSVPIPTLKLPPTKKLFSRKGRNWDTYEKFRAATLANPPIISTADAHLLFCAMKKFKRLSGDLKNLHNLLQAHALMYDLALSASKPPTK